MYRSRLARSPAEAHEWFKAPEVSLHAPPADRATPGRMNAAGVRAFYGALEERIAVAEVRPPIGSQVVAFSSTSDNPADQRQLNLPARRQLDLPVR